MIDKSINKCYCIPMQSTELVLDSKKRKEAAILDAACAVIREKGLHQARIVDIARKAGTSYGLVYHYFGSKANLFDAISNEWWNSLYTMIDAGAKTAAPVNEKLAAIINYFFDLYETRPNLVHIFVTDISRSTNNLTPERLNCFKRFFDRIERIIVGGQSEGTIRSDIRARYLTYIFVGSLEGFLSTMVLENQPIKGPEQKQRIANGLLEVFFNGARNVDRR
ncbi:MAG: TetR/AcrR family transcriptional regulator [Desulfomonile sp.]|nr:TetR/AcrR family transcriptional regulator [Desulfomonile sp.]